MCYYKSIQKCSWNILYCAVLGISRGTFKFQIEGFTKYDESTSFHFWNWNLKRPQRYDQTANSQYPIMDRRHYTGQPQYPQSITRYKQLNWLIQTSWLLQIAVPKAAKSWFLINHCGTTMFARYSYFCTLKFYRPRYLSRCRRQGTDSTTPLTGWMGSMLRHVTSQSESARKRLVVRICHHGCDSTVSQNTKTRQSGGSTK